MKTVKIPQNKTVGYLSNRYRLGHWWVPEMVLNVQSTSSFNKLFLSIRSTRSLTKPKLNSKELRGDATVEMIHAS